MADRWFYAKSGKRFGPVSSLRLRELAKSGQLQPADLVLREGEAVWKAAKKLAGLFPDRQKASASSGSPPSPQAQPRPVAGPPPRPPQGPPPDLAAVAKGSLRRLVILSIYLVAAVATRVLGWAMSLAKLVHAKAKAATNDFQ